MIKSEYLKINGKSVFCTTEVIGEHTWVTINGESFKLKNQGVRRLKESSHSQSGSGAISAPMPGQILKVFVKNDDDVEKGDSLFVVEAMKMEHTLKAPHSGKVYGLKFSAGDTVTGNDVILTVEKID